MTIVLQITDLLYIKYETQEPMVIQSIYSTQLWNGDDERGHAKYDWKKVGGEIFVHSTNSIPRTMKAERKKCANQIGHKIPNTKSSKERCSKNK